MTVEPPMAILRPNAGSVKSGMNTGNFDQDCIPTSMLPCAADHSLMDLNISVCSPSSQHMYESDFPTKDGRKDPLLSPSCSSICSISSPSLESFDFDLKPQFEQSKDLYMCDDEGRNLMQWGSLVGNENDSNMGNTLNMKDVIQVDELDLNQGPTLAQLNNEDSVSPFDDIEYIDLVDFEGYGLTKENTAKVPITSAAPMIATSSTSFSATGSNLASINNTSSATTVSRRTSNPKDSSKSKVDDGACDTPEIETKPVIHQGVAVTPPSANNSCLQELLMKKEQIVVPPTARPAIKATTTSASCASAPEKPGPKAGTKRSLSPDSDTNGSVCSVDRKWEEIKHFIHDEEPADEDKPPVKKIKEEPLDIAYNPQDDVNNVIQEETLDSEADGSGSDNDENGDYSDAESETSQASFLDEYVVGGKKERRYFWQYNTQSKGPKGKRLCKTVSADDPHVLNDFEDPVFDPEQNQMRYKHNGKARRGDGNDITPSPFKLYHLGLELEKLNNAINDMMPVSELPNPARSKTRKEKNKFASRACRLKKKAQHEANKLKLYGLEQEHRQLNHVLDEIKENMKAKLKGVYSQEEETLSLKLDGLIRQHLTEMIAGNTTDYVNSVLDKVVKGDRTGGISLND